MLPQVPFCELNLDYSKVREHQERERLTYGNRNHESKNRETAGRDPQQIYWTGIRNHATALFATVLKDLRSLTRFEIVTEEMTAGNAKGELDQ